jgi:hypothetical protein
MVRTTAEIVEISESVPNNNAGERSGRRSQRSRWPMNSGSSNGNSNNWNQRTHQAPSTAGPFTSSATASGSGRPGNLAGGPSRPTNQFQNRQPMQNNDKRRSGGRDTPSLSKTERADLLAQGKCFRCKEAGHLSRNCPKGNSVKGGRSGRPPGLSSNNIEFDFSRVDRLQSLAETTETLGDALTVGLIHFQTEGPMKWEQDPTIERRPCNGDFAVQRAVQLLNVMEPYPMDGDPTLDPDDVRFHVMEVDGGLHAITDFEQPSNGPELISTHLLFTSGFNLPLWYADRCAYRHGVALATGNWWEKAPIMGPVLSLGLVSALQEGMAEFPDDGDGVRDDEWSVMSHDDGARFWIRGHSTRRVVLIERARVLDPLFDFISWFRDQLLNWGDGPPPEPGMEPCWDGCEECALEGKFPPRRGWHCVGDWRAIAAIRMLEQEGPYPGDHAGEATFMQFSLNEVSSTHYRLRDSHSRTDHLLPAALVLAPESTLAYWYASRHLRQTEGGSALHLDLRFSERTVGIYMEEWICEELEKGAPYSSDHLWNRSTYDKRFTLEGGPDTNIWIIDHRRYVNREHMRTMLDVGFLENPLFDLRRWYAKIIYDLDAEDHKVDDPPATGGDDDQGDDPPGGDGNNPGPRKDTDRPGDGNDMPDL